LRAGGAGARDARGGAGLARETENRAPLGSISVGPAGNPQLTVAGGCGMRERGQLKGWGAWSPRCTRGAGLARETENRAHGLDIGGTCGKPPADGSGGLWDAGEGPLEGLGGLEPDMHKGGGLLITVN
jgi:hypothetical protein